MNIFITISRNKDDLDFSQLRKKLAYLSNQKVHGIRINFAKIEIASIFSYAKQIVPILSDYKDRFEFIFDFPFPKAKNRIIHLDQATVTQGQVLFLGNQESLSIASNFPKMIVDGDISESLAVGEIIYYGDGECAFCVKKKLESPKTYEIEAKNGFSLLLNKAVVCGLQKLEPVDMVKELIHYFNESNLHCMCAFSFVEDSQFIRNFSPECKIVSKIETQKGVMALSEILSFSDAVMLGRGDLALYSDYRHLLENTFTVATKTKACNKRLLAATDLVKSLRTQTFPSRADIMDISVLFQLGFSEFILSDEFSSLHHLDLVLSHIFYLCGGTDQE